MKVESNWMIIMMMIKNSWLLIESSHSIHRMARKWNMCLKNKRLVLRICIKNWVKWTRNS